MKTLMHHSRSTEEKALIDRVTLDLLALYSYAQRQVRCQSPVEIWGLSVIPLEMTWERSGDNGGVSLADLIAGAVAAAKAYQTPAGAAPLPCHPDGCQARPTDKIRRHEGLLAAVHEQGGECVGLSGALHRMAGVTGGACHVLIIGDAASLRGQPLLHLRPQARQDRLRVPRQRHEWRGGLTSNRRSDTAARSAWWRPVPPQQVMGGI